MAHMFEYSGPSWQNYLGMIRRCGLVERCVTVGGFWVLSHPQCALCLLLMD